MLSNMGLRPIKQAASAASAEPETKTATVEWLSLQEINYVKHVSRSGAWQLGVRPGRPQPGRLGGRHDQPAGFETPRLTPQQLELRSTRWATVFGRSLGISLGCLLGMLPLLFIDTDEADGEMIKGNNI
uniref:Essential MCU regulator, mitochondrial n=1 Tax=Macrostomum lignano TaxID=282301 RepID=A0A1I8FFT6_9PLAT